MPKRRLILHIGTHKTGTSYLQKLFLVNRDVLAAASIGLAEPPNPETGDHHGLVSVLRHELVEFLRREGDGRGRFLASLDTGHECTLLSSECLLPLLMRHPNLARACAQLVQARFDVSVVLYLRRQDYLKESVFAEVAACWYQGDIRNENHYWYDFGAIAEQVVDAFGAEALRVGIYRDDRPQDIAADFLTLCGLQHLPGASRRSTGSGSASIAARRPCSPCARSTTRPSWRGSARRPSLGWLPIPASTSFPPGSAGPSWSGTSNRIGASRGPSVRMPRPTSPAPSIPCPRNGVP